MTINIVKKEKFVTVRMSKEEHELLSLLAEKQGVKLSVYMRNNSILAGEKSIEHEQLIQSINSSDKIAGQETFHTMFNQLREMTLNSIKCLHEDLLKKIASLSKENDVLKRILEEILYTYLYHTPEVPQEKKQQAMHSALDRQKKVLNLISAKSENSRDVNKKSE